MNELKYNKAYLSPVNMLVIMVPLCGQVSFILLASTRPAAANTPVERLRTLAIDLIQAKVTCCTLTTFKTCFHCIMGGDVRLAGLHCVGS